MANLKSNGGAFTARELIGAAKAYIAADAERMSRRPAGCPRSAWREENPITLPVSWTVRDLRFKTKPKRYFWFDLAGNPYDLWISGPGPRFVGHIDLRAVDADVQLSAFMRR
jgi:hypothetical protein